MRHRFPALDAAIHALCNETDPSSVRAAFADRHLARMIALAPGVHHVVRVIAALGGELTALLDEQDIADPAVHNAVRTLIGAPEGKEALAAWAEVAPAGWGANIADDLINAARNRTCSLRVAAALIGACDEASALLAKPDDIAFAVRRWGQSVPNDPTTWITRLSKGEQKRILDTLRGSLFAWSSSLPWLPPDAITDDAATLLAIPSALEAFANASPTSRSQHDGLLARIINAALPGDLNALTRLACAMGSGVVWKRVGDLSPGRSEYARGVVIAAPWDNVPETVQRTILDSANTSDICAAVAIARGQRTKAPAVITWQSAEAFFAALDPKVWDEMDAATQRRWLDSLSTHVAYLAVRALGPRPEILMRALLENDLVVATRLHARDNTALRATLFPVVLRDTDVVAALRAISALPEPPFDPGAFFCIAVGSDVPAVVASARAALHTHADLVAAVALRRFAHRRMHVKDACAALQDALHGRTWNDLAPILALLNDAMRATPLPDRDALAAALAHPDRRDAMRAALDAVAALPPEIAIPALSTLELRHLRHVGAQDTAEALTRTLRDHGDLVLAVADALKDDDDLRAALLPLLEPPALADMIRTVLRTAPVVGCSLARALHQRAWHAVRAALLDAPFDHAHAVLRVMPADDVTALLSDATMTAHALAAGGRTDDVAAAFWRIAHNDLLCALALAALASDDPDVRARGVAALAQYPQTVRSLLSMLRPDVHDALRDHPALAAVIADLADDPPSARPTDAAPRAIHRRT